MKRQIYGLVWQNSSIKMHLKNKIISSKGLWILWAFFSLTALIIQLYTIDVLPHLQQDEAQITEYGRLVLNPESDWSINWRLQERKPLLLWSYLGPLIAELSFHIGGTSGIGPRIASIFGAILAATMALGWLLSRNVTQIAALGLSLAFLLDPLFVLSQRMGRVDSWVIALCLACCWILRISLDRKKRQANWLILLGGGLMATAALVWPSAIFLLPLILLELFQKSPFSNDQGKIWRVVGKKLLLFGLGGVITTMLLLLPIWNHLGLILNDSSAMISGNINASKSLFSRIFGLFNKESWFKFIKALIKTWTPLFPLLALAGIIIRKKISLIITFIIALSIIFASLVYEFRVLYLLPYFLLLSSSLFLKDSVFKFPSWTKTGTQITLGLLIFWSAFISLGLRTTLGAEVKSEKDRDKIFKAANQSIGFGEYNVYLDFTYEFYFTGRSLGWKLYTPYIQYSQDENGNWIRQNDHEPEKDFLQLLSEMDYALFYEYAVTPELEQRIASSGLNYRKVIDLDSESEPVTSVKSRNEEILLYFLRGREKYGSFILYSRVNSLNANL